MPDKLVMTKHLGDPPDEIPVEIDARSQTILINGIPMAYVAECYYSMPAPDWPKVQIQARRGFAKFWFRFGKRSGIMVDDDSLNAAFKVTSKDEEFAIMLLSPHLQSFILEKRSVDWSVGNGTLKLWYRGKLRKILIQHSLNRLSKFQGLIAEELFDWDAVQS